MSVSPVPSDSGLPTPSRSEVEDELLGYLRRHHAASCPDGLDDTTPLLDAGVIDSLSMMALIVFLENRFGLDFLRIDAERDDFRSVEVIADLVLRSSE